MHYNAGGVVGVCFLLMSVATSWGASCEEMPANSISRFECERTAKKEGESKSQPNEIVHLGNRDVVPRGVSRNVPKNVGNVQTPDEFVGSPMRSPNRWRTSFPSGSGKGLGSKMRPS
jgi:hypothetical protein